MGTTLVDKGTIAIFCLLVRNSTLPLSLNSGIEHYALQHIQ